MYTQIKCAVSLRVFNKVHTNSTQYECSAKCVQCTQKLSAQYLCVYLTKCTHKQYTVRMLCEMRTMYTQIKCAVSLRVFNSVHTNSTQYECCAKCVQCTHKLSAQYLCVYLTMCTHKQYTVRMLYGMYTNKTHKEIL